MGNSMYAGETRTITINVKVIPSGAPLPLTGYVLLWMAKLYGGTPDTDPSVIVKSSHGTPGGITFDPDQVTNPGLATLALAPTDTVGKAGTYTMGMKLFPGELEVIETPLTILRPIVQTTTAP